MTQLSEKAPFATDIVGSILITNVFVQKLSISVLPLVRWVGWDKHILEKNSLRKIHNTLVTMAFTLSATKTPRMKSELNYIISVCIIELFTTQLTSVLYEPI